METPITSTPATASKPSFLARLKRPRTIVLAIVLILVLVLFGQACSSGTDTPTETTAPTVSQVEARVYARSEGDIVTSGEVRASSEVTVLSEASTPVSAVYVELGQFVQAGQPLVSFVHTDLDAQLAQAAAGVARAEASLAVQEAGARDEERIQARLAVDQAQLALNASKTTRDNTYVTVENTLVAAYENGVASASSGFTTALDANLTVAGLQERYLNCSNTTCFRIAEHKANALKILIGAENAGRYNRTSILQEDGGLRARIDALTTGEINPQEVEPVLADLETALQETRLMLLEAREAMEAGFATDSATDADRLAVDTERAATVAAIASVQGSLQSVRAAEAGVLAREATTFDEIRYQDHPSVVSAEAAVAQNMIALENAKQNLQIAESGARPVDLAVSRAAVQEAQAAYNALASRLRQVEVTAPISGTIASVSAKEGSLVSPGQPLVEIVNPSILEVTTYITADDYPEIRFGTPATIDDAYTGIVTAVSPAVSSSGKIEVTVSIQDQATIPVGSFVSVTLRPESNRAATTYSIPLSAVQLTANGSFVYHAGSASQVVEHLISTGDVLGDRIEVTNGLTDDTVFIENIRGLKPGDVVNVQ